jgi:nicotinate-nucleotide adenylyltransferase
MARFGCFGGSFNPPHLGHLLCAELVRERFNLDKILFIPNNISPLKENPSVSAQDRFNMVILATKGNPFFKVIDIELKRRGISYTVDTVRELAKIYPNDKFSLILGIDEANDFKKWREYNFLLNSLSFIILDRPGYDKSRIKEIFGDKAIFFNMYIDISSTDIRRRIMERKSIKYMVPAKVREYIKSHKLYQ